MKTFQDFSPYNGPNDSRSIIWRKILECFHQKLNFFSTEERMTWTSWMKWG